MSSELPPNPITDTFNPAYWDRSALTEENINVILTGIARLKNTQTFTGINTFTQLPLNTATQPAFNDSSTIIPSTAWVQGAIGFNSTDNITPQTITITPNPSLDLDNPATFSYIKNNFGSNSSLPVSVFSSAPTGTQIIRQNLCEIDFGSNAIAYGTTIQFRYTNNIYGTDGDDDAYCWDNGTFFVSPVLLNNASLPTPYTANTSQAVATTGDSGFFMTARDTGSHQPTLNPNPFTSLTSVPIVYMEYIFGSNKIILYVKNTASYFPSFSSPSGNLVATTINFNIEVLNNSGARVSTSTPYSTAMYVNTTRSVV